MPVIADVLALKVSDPEGFVSDAEYFAPTPAGRPPTETTAVSLGEPIWIGTVTDAEPGMTVTVETGRNTVMGFIAELPPPPPQPTRLTMQAQLSVRSNVQLEEDPTCMPFSRLERLQPQCMNIKFKRAGSSMSLTGSTGSGSNILNQTYEDLALYKSN